jgi:hypothetical protein
MINVSNVYWWVLGARLEAESIQLIAAVNENTKDEEGKNKQGNLGSSRLI